MIMIGSPIILCFLHFPLAIAGRRSEDTGGTRQILPGSFAKCLKKRENSPAENGDWLSLDRAGRGLDRLPDHVARHHHFNSPILLASGGGIV